MNLSENKPDGTKMRARATWRGLRRGWQRGIGAVLIAIVALAASPGLVGCAFTNRTPGAESVRLTTVAVLENSGNIDIIAIDGKKREPERAFAFHEEFATYKYELTPGVHSIEARLWREPIYRERSTTRFFAEPLTVRFSAVAREAYELRHTETYERWRLWIVNKATGKPLQRPAPVPDACNRARENSARAAAASDEVRTVLMRLAERQAKECRERTSW